MVTSFAPDRRAFVDAYNAGKPQIVWASLVADLETPVSAMMKLAGGQDHSFLLESVEGGAVRGRYSIIGTKPDLIWRSLGSSAEVNRSALIDKTAFEPMPQPTLESLRSILQESRIDLPKHLPPMAAGLFGFMTYDMVRQMEKLPEINPKTIDIPDAVFIRPSLMAIFDNIEDRVTIVTPVWQNDRTDADQAFDLACERVNNAVADFDRGVVHIGPPIVHPPVEPHSNVSQPTYHSMVERAKDYILAGDIFQVVPSQRFRVPFKLPAFSLYRALRRLNPSPFLFFLDLDGYALVGSSPEILVRLRDEQITIRPLAGTRRRGASAEEDQRLAAEMLADPKEIAEHIMLLDLGRNDVGRVAEVGSVNVTSKMNVEYYSHVMHIVSNVEGRIRPEYDALDALIAGFPAGTVSGAPKIRAMEIIEELESERRSFYAGTVGYFSADGNMDTCIALRTALVKNGEMIVQAGGGVVADSDPEAEYQESLNKAQALIRAAEEAIRTTRNYR
ncbi:MAG: anthranilate synthase component I [Pseudomonadota bacterium]